MLPVAFKTTTRNLLILFEILILNDLFEQVTSGSVINQWSNTIWHQSVHVQIVVPGLHFHEKNFFANSALNLFFFRSFRFNLLVILIFLVMVVYECRVWWLPQLVRYMLTCIQAKNLFVIQLRAFVTHGSNFSKIS